MKKSDKLGLWSMVLAIAGAIAFFALGAGIGATQSDLGQFSTTKITDVTNYPGDGFNWLLALLGGGMLMLLAMIAGAAGWIVEAIEKASAPRESPVAE